MSYLNKMAIKNRIPDKVLAALRKRYPVASTQLTYQNPWELLVAVILSAQCTDARVNEITPRLFSRWPDPADLALATQEDVEEIIHSAGFFRNKARNLRACAKMVHELHGDIPPPRMDALIKLPGVARKSANVILFGGYGINAGLAVDTHVKRISYRLGLTKQTDPVRVERDLMSIFPREEWGNLNHRMVWFGRDVCRARKPGCVDCEMRKFCPKNTPPGPGGSS